MEVVIDLVKNTIVLDSLFSNGCREIWFPCLSKYATMDEMLTEGKIDTFQKTNIAETLKNSRFSYPQSYWRKNMVKAAENIIDEIKH